LVEAKSVLALLNRTLERPETVRLSADQRAGLQSARDRLAAIVDRGKVTADERTWLVWTGRKLLVTVFQ
jgi:hypothetical protein